LGGTAQTIQAYADAHIENHEISPDILADLEEKSDVKAASQYLPIQARNMLAVDALQAELQKEKATTEFEQMKITNSSEMDVLLKSL
jgi:predicted nucleic acid-binding protein